MKELTFNDYKKIGNFKNNFEKYKDVKSKLCCGNINNIKNPFLSIVIPTYNRIETLSELLNKLIGFNIDFEYEIIVVDNSSNFSDSNQTFKFIKNLNHPNILYYINESNLGQAGNMNRCFELANSNLVAMIHDDDLVTDNYIDEITACLKNIDLNTFGFLRTGLIAFESGKVPNNVSYDSEKHGKSYKIGYIWALFHGIGTSDATGGTVFNKKAILDVGGFDEDFFPGFDYILGYQMLLKNYKEYITENPIGLYRWSLNETLRKDVLINFNECDYLFREYMYSKNILFKLFGKVFSGVFYTIYTDLYYNKAKKYNIDMEYSELIKHPIYKKRKLRKKIADFMRGKLRAF